MGLRFCSLNRDGTGFCSIGVGGQRSLVHASHVPGAGPGFSRRRLFGGLSFASLLLVFTVRWFHLFPPLHPITSWRGGSRRGPWLGTTTSFCGPV